MREHTRQKTTAIMLAFPARPRLKANKFAEQLRQARELEAARTAPVLDASGWYHDDAVKEQAGRA